MPTLFAPMSNILDPDPEKPAPLALDRPGRAARILAWCAGILSLPGGLAALYGAFLIVPPILFAIGIFFLWGYIGEARGRPRSRAFWRGSMVFNLLLLAGTTICILYGLGDPNEWLGLLVLMAGWQTTAIHLGQRALRSRDDRPGGRPLAH